MKKILSLLCLVMLAVTSAWAESVKVTWTTGDVGGFSTAADPGNAATDITYSVGAGLTENGTSKYGDLVLTKFDQNTGDNKGSNGNHDQNVGLGKYVDFTFTPLGGDFTPTRVSFDIVKNGTGDPSCDVDFIDGAGKTITVASNATVIRNNDTASSAHSYEVSGAETSDGAVTLRIIIGKLASGKSVSITNVVVEGELVSADAPVLGVTKSVTLKSFPLQLQPTATLALTGKNLTDGTYDAPVPMNEGLSIAPATFTVANGVVSQEFTLTYAPTADVESAAERLLFTVDGLTAIANINLTARVTPYEWTYTEAQQTWDWEKLTETIELGEGTVPTNTQDFVFRELEDQIDFSKGFGVNASQKIVISNTTYPTRNKRFQNGTIKFRTKSYGTLAVDFSDTGASGEGMKRYLNVQGANTEFYADRAEIGSDKVTADEIYVRPGEVAITGMKEDGVSSAPIIIYKVTWTPAEADPDVTDYCIVGELTGGWPDDEAQNYTDKLMQNTGDGIYTLVVKNFVPTEAREYEYKLRSNYSWQDTYQLPAIGNQNFYFGSDMYPLGQSYTLTFTANVNENKLTLDVSPKFEKTTFDFTSAGIRENIGEGLADVKGNIYNETFTADGVTMQVTAGSAATKLYVDNKVGQNLVTYKDYATMTFRAPEGKAITKIEFELAKGNFNFEASSGAIEETTWTGNADGVRFFATATTNIAKAIVTLSEAEAKDKLADIEYVEVESIARFNALQAGTYAKLTLTDAEVIAKSADGFSTAWIQDATGGAWIQYCSLIDQIAESTKLNGTVYAVKRDASGNPQIKEAEDTPKSELTAEAIDQLTVIEGETIAAVNTAENLNRVVKLSGASLAMTSATAGTLTLGEETIAVNNGGETANQQLCKIANWAKDTNLENIAITAILVAKSTTENQLLPISIEMLDETEAGEEIACERYVGLGYGPSTYTVDFTAAKEFLGVENVTTSMLSILNPDGSEVTAYANYDGWFAADGTAMTWGDLNAEGNVQAGICVKFFQALEREDASFEICDMNGADVIGASYTVKWALKANGKTYTYTINVAFAEAPKVELQKSSLAIQTSVEYPSNCSNHQKQIVSLTDEQMASILAELGLESIDAADIYGYNPTTEELILLDATAGYDGWRDANGDFAYYTSDPTVPACVKYTDGQNYECYSIAGCEAGTTIPCYWAIANSEKYVLVEIDFTYAEPKTIELELTGTEVEINVTYNVASADYTEQVVSLSEEQASAILTAIGLGQSEAGFEDKLCHAYIYDPTTGTFDNDNYDGWRGTDGLGHSWTGNLDAPFCAQFSDSNDLYFYNLQNIEPQTFTTYFAVANDETGKAALIKVNFVYEGTLPTYTVAGAFKAGDAEEASFFGTAWDETLEANNMEHSTADRNLWTLSFKDVQLTPGTILYKVVADHNWETNWGFNDNNADYVVNEEGIYDVTFSFNPVGKVFNDFNLTCELVGYTDIYLKPEAGADIAAALEEAKAGIAKVGNITIELEQNAQYTVGATLTAPKNFALWGNDATVIVTEENANPLITLDGTSAFAMKSETEASDHKLISNVEVRGVVIKGLQNSLVKDNQKTLLENLYIDWANIQMPASGKSVLDFNGKGYVGNVVVSNSTIWAADKHTGFFAQYGSRPKNVNAEWLQVFDFQNSTIVNIANGKNFCDLKQNGTAQNVVTLRNNIFVDCGKDNQVVVGFNKGQTSATPIWDVEGNYFEVAGACSNAAETEKAGQKDGADIVMNSIDGTLAFTDAANGDFNGIFALSEGTTAPESLGAPMWTIEFSATDGISSISSDAAALQGEVYNLNGQKMQRVRKGLYIVNGKKQVVR